MRRKGPSSLYLLAGLHAQVQVLECVATGDARDSMGRLCGYPLPSHLLLLLLLWVRLDRRLAQVAGALALFVPSYFRMCVWKVIT